MAHPETALSGTSVGYRPDIDGLRAFAVMGVVVFHALPNSLQGGFVGVDVFFVISGFLITTIIMRQIHEGTFSFRRFYSRRIRRIFPALFITLAASLVFGLLFLYPSELHSISAQSLSAATFVANIYFWLTTSYFAESSSQVALLHLWTLGLEEQYYLIWPLVLFLLFAIARFKAKYIVLLLLGISFAINIKYYRWQPEWAFFLPPARFWELFAGGALALFSSTANGASAAPGWARSATAAIAFLLLLWSFLFVDESRFPGWQALAPVSATVLLIWAGPATAVSRNILSNRAVVWVGLVSYPLYLYHWPLLAFFQTSIFSDYPRAAILVSVLLSFVLAALTFKYVEVPVRRSRSSKSIAMVLIFALSVTLVALLIRTGHLEGRIRSHEVMLLEDAAKDWVIPWDNYRRQAGFELLDLQNGESNILVTGDSHASQYYAWFKRNLPEFLAKRRGVQFATYGGCPLLPDANRREAGYGCPQFYEFVQAYAQSETVQTIILSVWWEHYFGLRYGEDDAPMTLDIGLGEFVDVARKLGDDLEKLTYAGKKVIVLLSNPSSPGFDPGAMLSRVSGSA